MLCWFWDSYSLLFVYLCTKHISLVTSFIVSLNIMYSKSSLFFFCCFYLLNILCILILCSAI